MEWWSPVVGMAKGKLWPNHANGIELNKLGMFCSFRINEIYSFVILSICISAVGVCLIPVIKLPSVMNCQRRCDYSRVSPRQRLYLVYLNSTHIIHHISHAVRHENLYLHSSLCWRCQSLNQNKWKHAHTQTQIKHMESHSGWVDGHLLLVLAQREKKCPKGKATLFLLIKQRPPRLFLPVYKDPSLYWFNCI